MRVTLRQASLEDLEWLEPFYESLMRPYVELTHSWCKTEFRETFDPDFSSIIVLNGEDIGFMKVEPRSDCIYLEDLQVKPNYQRRGLWWRN